MNRYNIPSCVGLNMKVTEEGIECSFLDKKKKIPSAMAMTFDEHLDEIYIWYRIQEGIALELKKTSEK